MSHAPQPPHKPCGDATAAPAPAGACPLTADDAAALPSFALLNGRPSVIIDHDGERHVLRATRAGRLILTK